MSSGNRELLRQLYRLPLDSDVALVVVGDVYKMHPEEALRVATDLEKAINELKSVLGRLPFSARLNR